MAQYANGVRFEYLVRDYLLAQGYSVIRAAGSRGIVDLLAWSKDEVLLCQCKKEKSKKNYVNEKERLAGVQLPPGGRALLWVKRGKMVFVHPIGRMGRIREFDIKMMMNVVEGVNGH